MWPVKGSQCTVAIISYGFLTLIVLLLIMHIQTSQKTIFVTQHPQFPYNYENEEPLDKNQVCQFPNLDPFDKSLMGYVWQALPIRCKGRHFQLTYLDKQGFLRFNMSAVSESGYQLSKITCKYQEITRPPNDDFHPKYGDEILFNGTPNLITAEFITVWCTNLFGFSIYSDFLSQVIPKDEIKLRANDDTKLSVYIFVVDSMSRLQCIRQLPKTHNFLTKTMDSVVMRGDMVIGDNTYPNIMPLLTGMPTIPHPEFINDTKEYEELKALKHFDEWPLIFQQFKDNGYATLLFEDRTPLSLFNYKENGFKNQPTLHYPRPFWMALEWSTLGRMSSNMCFGRSLKHNLFLDYAKQFISKYKNKPYFALSILTEINHDYVNILGAADDDFLRFMEDIYNSGDLENTIFVFMGDHGHRMDSIASTYIGSVEKRMPFLSIHVPQWFRKKFPKAMTNLQNNSKRLTSIYDLHSTLESILLYAEKKNVTFGSSQEPSLRPTSLFEPISLDRTCLHAGIPLEYCVCDDEVPIDTGELSVRDAATKLLQEINLITLPYAQFCLPLKLERVERATIKINKKITNLKDFSISSMWMSGSDAWIRIIVEAAPNKALFEGLVQAKVNGTMKIINSINRVNRYGNQAACLTHDIISSNPSLPLFCYCYK